MFQRLQQAGRGGGRRRLCLSARTTRPWNPSLSILAAVLFAAGVYAQQQTEAPAKRPTVLFMCPHGAAKSVLASAYFEQLAKARGLHVRVESAGTDPDPTVSPAVAAHLKRQGYAVPEAAPRKVTASDLATADVVISIGCDLSALPAPRGRLIRWDDVPPLSEDFARSDEVLRRRVMALVKELAQTARREWE